MGEGRACRDCDRRRRRTASPLSRQDQDGWMSEAVIAEWQARIRAAAASGTPLVLRGGGTKDFYGERPLGDVLETKAYEGIVDYDPTELVVTARAGTSLAHVERTLRASWQMLACEPPLFVEAG